VSYEVTRMRYSLVIFDLDGTLADSFPWFLRVVKDVARKYGFKPIVNDDIEPHARNPAAPRGPVLEAAGDRDPHARAQARSARAHPAVPRHGRDVAVLVRRRPDARDGQLRQ
jgi:beta-phosphoglucomutase-like phosphatase (HAD superfamily)